MRAFMQTGSHGRYNWLETDHDLREFLALCPDTILSKHIVITAVDSGSFNPSDQDRAAGWSATGGIAYSPRLDAVTMLPRDCCCRDCGPFDEWYIYGTEAPELGSICHANVFDTAIAPPSVFQFVNFCFRFSDQQMKAVADLFWKQIEWMQPESYLGDGNSCLLFVSSNGELFRGVETTLSRSPSRSQGSSSG